LEEKVNSTVKKRRAEELRSLVSSISVDEKTKLSKNNQLDMIIEEPSDKIDGWRGYSKNYLNIHLKNEKSGEAREPGNTLEVKVTRVNNDFCIGESLKLNRHEQRVTETGNQITSSQAR
jgi:tRNA A37 methylthiotransferase MiaB